LGMEQDASTVDGLAEPLWLRKITTRIAQHFGLPAILVIVPTCGKIAVQQMHQPDVVEQLDAIGFCGERATVFRGREIGNGTAARIECVEKIAALPAAIHRSLVTTNGIWLQRQRSVVTIERAA